jgi:hypothetical protein
MSKRSFSDLSRSWTFKVGLPKSLQPTTRFGSYELSAFDTGTMWLEIGLDKEDALMLVLIISNVVQWYFGYKKTNAAQLADARKHADADDVVTIERTFSKMLQAKREEAILRVLEHRSGTEPEDRQRLGVAIDILADLMAAGGDIVPALGAPAKLRKAYEINRTLTAAPEPPRLAAAPAATDRDDGEGP